MRVDLKAYQSERTIDLLQELDAARREIVRRSRAQAIIFDAPTGAGKTVMAAAMMENALFGGDLAAEAEITPDAELTFLWVSDDPDLNEQSRRRIGTVCEQLAHDRLEIIENTFDRSVFEPGKCYFLNTQKLRAGGLLSTLSNARSHTIWETIANTQAIRPGRFILILDEAHRGLQLSAAESAEARTIAGRFVAGTDAVQVRPLDNSQPIQFPPVELILGMSATPDRFDQYLARSAGRTRRSVSVEAARVRESGIIKDRLTLFGLEEGQQHPWTLLDEALAQLRRTDDAWRAYTANNALPPIAPLLMLQVEDAHGGAISATDLTAVLAAVRDSWPELQPDQIVHCFGEHTSIDLGDGWVIAHEHPADISEKTQIRVVLFKTALNTGWDCPRAEVLMSFRHSEDPTPIAQLVGRMVRTPLARRVDGHDDLNTAYLFLPFFNRARLLAIKDRLTSDEGGVGSEIELNEDYIDLILRPSALNGGPDESVFRSLHGLRMDTVPPTRPTSDLHRLFRLGRHLDQDGIGRDAAGIGVVARFKGELIQSMQETLDSLTQADATFDQRIAERRELRLTTLSIRGGEVIEAEEIEEAEGIEVSDNDIETAFRAASSVLGAELGTAWNSARYDEEDPLRAKIEFLEIAADPNLRAALQARAQALFQDVFDEHRPAILQLSEARQQEYLELTRVGRTVQTSFMLPPTLVRFPNPQAGQQQDRHLYVLIDTQNDCPLELNEWERDTLNAERAQATFRGFLRNLDRKPWALSYAYQSQGGWKPGYPDFLVFHEAPNNEIRVSILEPHQGEDSLVKARGLASFAERFAADFDRVEMVRKLGDGRLVRLRLHDPAVRGQLTQQLEQEDFTALFA